ncbi:hypothetical protein M405DRAFT_912352, partial [Rhizopogon salebrosus TDB-379]
AYASLEPFSSQRTPASPKLLGGWAFSQASIRKNMSWHGEVTDAVHEKKSFIFCQPWAFASPDVLAKENNSLACLCLSHSPFYPPAPVPRVLTEKDISPLVPWPLGTPSKQVLMVSKSWMEMDAS